VVLTGRRPRHRYRESPSGLGDFYLVPTVSQLEYRKIKDQGSGLRFFDSQANWQIITWRIQPVQICTAGWAGHLRPGPLMRKLWR
jgi:hypothetical protein